MLKEARYRKWGVARDGSLHTRVAYAIIGNRCYFSALDRGTSTINAAEDAMQCIAKQEGVPVESLNYIDIQTYRGYRKYPGEYETDELEFVMERESDDSEQIVPRVTGWKKALLPPNAYDLFKDLIGADLKVKYICVYHESEGLYAVKDYDGKFLYVQADGTPATRKYEDLTGFQNGHAWVRNEEQIWFQIDRQDKRVNDVTMTHLEFLDKFFPMPKELIGNPTA